MVPLQVIGAGFARTGTHNLCVALDKLKYVYEIQVGIMYMY